MIEPIRWGQALLDEIAATRPKAGGVAVWWLGQSGFVLKSADLMIVIDPYLSEHLTTKYEGTEKPHVRMTRAPIRGGELTGVDFVLASHKHSDHLDPGTLPDLLKVNPEAILVLPESLLGLADTLGLPTDRLTGLVAGQSFHGKGISIRAVPSAHEGLDTDELGRHLYLGFVIDMGGLCSYHSGDTLAYEGLDEAIGPGPMDLMFLPINGKDPARGVPGNMSAEEAVALANRVGPRWVVPHHYDMFTFNTVPVARFEEAAEGLSPVSSPVVLRCGERKEFSR